MCAVRTGQLVAHILSQPLYDNTQFVSLAPKVMEKAQLAYSGNFAKLKDLRRASVVCPTIKEVTTFVKAVQDSTKLTICRVKNRFDKSYDANLSGGYRDLQLNIVAEGGFIWVSPAPFSPFLSASF